MWSPVKQRSSERHGRPLHVDVIADDAAEDAADCRADEAALDLVAARDRANDRAGSGADCGVTSRVLLDAFLRRGGRIVDATAAEREAPPPDERRTVDVRRTGAATGRRATAWRFWPAYPCAANPCSVGETTCCGLYGWACDANARSFFSASSRPFESCFPHAVATIASGAARTNQILRMRISCWGVWVTPVWAGAIPGFNQSSGGL